MTQLMTRARDLQVLPPLDPRTRLIACAGFQLRKWAFHAELASWLPNRRAARHLHFARGACTLLERYADQLHSLDRQAFDEINESLKSLRNQLQRLEAPDWQEGLFEKLRRANKDTDPERLWMERDTVALEYFSPFDLLMMETADARRQHRPALLLGLEIARLIFPTPVWKHLRDPSDDFCVIPRRDPEFGGAAPRPVTFRWPHEWLLHRPEWNADAREEIQFRLQECRLPNLTTEELASPFRLCRRLMPLPPVASAPEAAALSRSRQVQQDTEPTVFEAPEFNLTFEHRGPKNFAVVRTLDGETKEFVLESRSPWRFLLAFATSVGNEEPGSVRSYEHIAANWHSHYGARADAPKDLKGHCQNLVCLLNPRLIEFQLSFEPIWKVGYKLEDFAKAS